MTKIVRPVKKEKSLLENEVPRKMLGLLLKEELSSSDLADKIYGKRNVRSSISPYLKKFKEKGWITERNTFTKKVLYKARLEVLGGFDKREYDFIQLVIERFWNPSHALNDDLIESLKDVLLSTLIVKKLYKIKKIITKYNPKKDLEFYRKNKERFWRDSIFRDNQLNKIRDNGENKNHATGSFYLSSEFIFISLLVPETLFNKIEGKHHNKTNPLFIFFSALSK